MKRWRFAFSLAVLMIGALAITARSQTPQLAAPQVDRIGFPAGYQSYYKLLLEFDRTDTGQIRVIYGNDLAASREQGETYPYGSILIFEGWNPARDSQNNIVLDERGRFVKGHLTTVFVMRKERGFGTAYKELRNGEWEYVSYTPDGTYATAPSNSAGCAQCHLQAKETDFVFRSSSFARGPAKPATGAPPDGVILNYRFLPGVVHVKAGTPVTFYNVDEFDHNMVATGSFNSGLVHPGDAYQITLDKPGTYEYICTIHRGMRGTVIVDPPDNK